MKVPGILYTSERMIKEMGSDESPKQVANVAHLPALLNIRSPCRTCTGGYGFPIGGCRAFEMSDGIVSPGGVRLRYQLRLPYDNHRLVPGRYPQPATGSDDGAVSEIPPASVRQVVKNYLRNARTKKVLLEGSKWAVDSGLSGRRKTWKRRKTGASWPGPIRNGSAAPGAGAG